MFLAKVSINQPVMMTMVILVFIIFGAISYFSLNLNQMPEVEIPYVTVTTVYPGAGPEEIETQITKKIEDAVSTVSEIKNIDSYTLDGFSILLIEFKLSKNVDVANQEVKDKIDQILNDLPDDAQKPIVQKVDIQAFPIIDLVLSGDVDPRELYDIADKTLKDRFSQIPGVAKVNITGGQEREIKVKLNGKTAYEQSISLPQLLQILKAYNMNIPGGYFQIKDQEYTVRLKGEFDNLNEIANQQIMTASGVNKLGKFAKIVDGGKNVRERSIYFDNIKKTRDENVVRLGIIKSSEGNVVKVADAVAKELPDIRRSLPPGVSLDIVNDNSVFVRSTVSDTIGNILLGVLFTSVVLFIFLHDIRATLIVALSMPTSIISTFLLMQMFDMSLNIMSLMGISVSVGVLVANSVVVLENIFWHKSTGKSKKEAAYWGTKGVTVAVIASTLTNLVVFLPIANMSSIVGRFLAELALAASFSTIFSLIMSFTLTPMLASIMLPKEMKSGPLGKFIDKWSDLWERLYTKALNIIVRKKIFSFIVILLSFGGFIGSILFFFPSTYDKTQENRISSENFPVVDNGNVEIKVELPSGYNLHETALKLTEIENILKKDKDIKHILTTVGKISDLDVGTNLAVMDVKLVDQKDRKMHLLQKIDMYIKELADVANARIIVGQKGGMGGSEDPIEFFILGQDIDKLEMYKDSVIKRIADVPGLINFDNSSRPGKPEITIIPKRDKLSEMGLTVADLALTLRASIEGIESSKYRQAGNEYDITVTLTDNSIKTPEDIGNIPVVSMAGQAYRLSQVADVDFTTGYSKILHRNKFKAVKFTGGNSPDAALGDVTAEIAKRLDKINFDSGYKWAWGGNVAMMGEMQQDFAFAFLLAIILTYMLLAAILESFFQPMIILLTLPLAMIGVFFAMYYFNIKLNIVSNMAIVMLIGVVVNNAILILDNTNQYVRDEGMNPHDAIVRAAPEKLRAIVMSTAAIILGMLPMALGIGDTGAEMRIPLGVVSIGGLIVSSLLTLFVIPSFYYLVSRRKTKHKEVLNV